MRQDKVLEVLRRSSKPRKPRAVDIVLHETDPGRYSVQVGSRVVLENACLEKAEELASTTLVKLRLLGMGGGDIVKYTLGENSGLDI